jgi:hypothetical protein
MTTALLAAFLVLDPIRFLVGFLVLICILAIVILGIRMLARLAGVSIPQELMVILGIILFLILIYFLLDYSGMHWR